MPIKHFTNAARQSGVHYSAVRYLVVFSRDVSITLLLNGEELVMPISAVGHRKNVGTFENKFLKYNTNIIQEQIISIARSQQEKVPVKPGGIAVLYTLSAILPHIKMVVNSSAEPRGGIVMYNGTAQNTPSHNGKAQIMAAAARNTNYPKAESRPAPIQNHRIPNIISENTNIKSNLYQHMGKTASEFFYQCMQKLDALVTQYDPLRFPTADATPVGTGYLSQNGAYWDQNNHIYVIKSELTKKKFIESLLNFLVVSGQLTDSGAEKLETYVKENTSGIPFFLTPVIKFENESSRAKRISEADRNRYIGEHIREHCAYEADVLNTKGENEGKAFMFWAGRLENPLRMIYDNTDESPSPLTLQVTSGLNFFSDILTLGLKPLIGNLIANYLRREYYLSQGDEICAERQRHLIIAELATGINVEGFAFRHRGKAPILKPREIMHSVPLSERAAYSLRNPATGVQEELLIKIVDNKKTASATHDGKDNIYLKPTDQNEFMTYHSHPAKPDLPERRVIFDEEKSTWRYADSVDAAELNVQFSKGKSFIHLQGEKHELRMNRHRQYEAVVHKTSGTKEYLPVYREPLSREWHLEEHNGHSVFNTRQKKIINDFNIPIGKPVKYIAEQNGNQKRYGAGIIYRVEDTDAYSNDIFYKAIEMNGMVVPVRERITSKNRLHYEIFDISNNQKETYPVEFDGARWLFERPTSIHASNSLKKAVTRDMLVDMDASQLSAPGHRGLRWDAREKSYLKVHNKYLPIKKLNGNRYSIKAPMKGNRIYLRYNNEKFSVETARERLNNILTEGLSGRKRTLALDVLKEQDGFTEGSARELLLEYQFPKDGFFDDYNFALEIEQTGKVPRWAKRFKKSHSPENAQSEAQKTVSVFAVGQPEHPIELKLGDILGEGCYGKVFTDASDNNYVIKKYVRDNKYLQIDIKTLTNNESNSFRRYYGEDSATLYHNEEEDFYLRMYRIPGRTVPQLPPDTLPPDAIERYVDMLEKLNHVGILHGDLHEGNIMWDDEAEIFHPIDIYNVKDQYFSGNSDNTLQNDIEEEEWLYLVDDITAKMKSNVQV
ncbi:hypothetical protein ACL2XO_06175 [Sodalis sp. RH15]|uniref:OspG family effector kinase n=1 Tax=Sodalis sp. RH15 TaxID=3394330 RepID=UPI0039B4BBF0